MSTEPYSKDFHYEYDEDQPVQQEINHAVPLHDSIAKQAFLTRKENENKLKRLVQVRKQEQEKSRAKIVQKALTEQNRQQSDFVEEKLNDYQAKLKEIEELERLKDISLKEIGQAHRNADHEMHAQNMREQEKENHRENFNHFIKEKSKEAKEWQQKMERDRNAALNNFIEKRQQVLQEENNRAKTIAEEHRRRMEDQSVPEKDFYDYQQYDKTLHRKNFYTKASIDYSSSYTHNPLVVSHKNDAFEVDASQAAEKENIEASKRMSMMSTQKEMNKKKSTERATKAFEKDKTKQMYDEINAQLDKISKFENEKRINEGKSYPEMQAKPAKKLVVGARNDKLAEMEFEDAFQPRSAKQTTANTPARGGLPQSTRSIPKKITQKQESVWNKRDKSKPNSKGFLTDDDRSKQEIEDEQDEEVEEPKPLKSKQNERFSPVSKGAQQKTESDEDNRMHQQYPHPFEDDRTQQHKQNPEAEQAQPDYPQQYHPSHLQDAGQFQPQQHFQPMNQYPQQHPLDLYQQQQQGYPNQAAPYMYDPNFQGQELYNPNMQAMNPNVYPNQQFGVNFIQGPAFNNQMQQQSFPAYQAQAPVMNQQQMQYYQPDGGYNYWPYRATDNGPMTQNFMEQQPTQPIMLNNNAVLPHNIASMDAQQNAFNPPRDMKSPDSKFSTSQIGSESGMRSPGDFDNSSIKNYIKEQEEFLRKLDEDKKKLRDRMREEEESRVNPKVEKKSPVPERKAKTNQWENTITSEPFSDEETQKKSTRQANLSPNGEQLKELKRKADELLNKFMNPSLLSSKNESSYQSQYNYKDLSETSPSQKFRSPDRDFASPSNYNSENTTLRQGISPNSKTVTFHGIPSSPSELNYSVSDRGDRSDKKSTRARWHDEERQKRIEQEDKVPKSEAFEIAWGDDSDKSNKNETLADAFKKHRKDLVERLEQEKSQHSKAASDKLSKGGKRTKEEILRQRKEMMEYRAPKQGQASKTFEQNITDFKSEANPKNQTEYNSRGSRGTSKEPNPELMDRLAYGKRHKVNKKDMYELTSKNFDMLPEIKKKKDEEKRKEELRARKEKVKQLDQKLRGNSIKAK